MDVRGRTLPVPGATRYPLLSTVVDTVDRSDFLEALGRGVEGHERFLVLNHNLHSLALCQRDEVLRSFFDRADLIFIDGTSVVAISKMLGIPATTAHRHAVLDWFWDVVETAAERGWRIVHIGSEDPVIGTAMEKIRSRCPGADFVAMSGYFDHVPGSQGTQVVLERLQDLAPDLILLGFGMPIQEHWLAAVADRLPPCPVVTVGGILGYIGDDRPTAPRWLGPLGMEWAYRLATEPRRLWRRYLVEPWTLAIPLTKELLGRYAPSWR